MYTQDELRRLNPERLDLLADELESGRHVKGEGWLAQLDGGVWKECCMGVGTEVARSHGLELDEYEGVAFGVTDGPVVRKYGNKMESGVFPEDARVWFGFNSANPKLPLPEGVEVPTGRITEPTMSKFQAMGTWNDHGPAMEGPESDFTTIATAIRRLAQMARDAQAEPPEYQHPE